ncbi:hypothetical protein CASFOL_000817 [Castilleja foliolosa]|uniref:Uncharacterized protein n=1 Tax=Castilleja foliolosa TaxID=1961234 RepID=A0ABD3EP22_9LAMI
MQELGFSEEHIQSSEALIEMSQGHWEGCHRSEIYTPETLSLMEKFQPDFSAPSGESLRQVEFRMVQFLNSTIMAFPEKYRSDFSPPDPTDNPNSLGPPPSWLDLQHRHRPGLHRKKSGKSRLQIVTRTDEADDEMSPRVPIMMSQGLNVRTYNNRLDGRVNVLYSTPSIYTDAKHALNEPWPLKTSIHFLYAGRINGYWTGYFTSRPAIKGYVRMMSVCYMVTGTEKQHVADDYAKRLSIGYKESEDVVAASLDCLTQRECKSSITKFNQCPLLNISYCPATEVDLSGGKKIVSRISSSLFEFPASELKQQSISSSLLLLPYHRLTLLVQIM